MSFSNPGWLTALLVIPLVWWIYRRGIGAVPLRQRRAAMIVRCLIIAAIVLALSGLAFSLPERRLATVFVVDVSDSVGSAARGEAHRFVQESLEGKPKDALAGIVAFAGDARVELGLQEEPELISIASRPDPSRSDLARALRLGSALMPDGARRRIVLLSDGRENVGDARAEAESLEAQGLRVDTVEITGDSGPDAAVLEVDAPSRARVGERFQVEATVASNASMAATAVLRRGERVIARREVDLEPGQRKVRFKGKATKAGSLNYTVELEADRDSVPHNDNAAALTLVAGRPRVAIVEGAPNEGSTLARALKARGMVTERMSPAGFPSGEMLAELDAIVLVDVPADALTESQIGRLEGFVRDLGRGLVTVGGESSWSLGNYEGTRLEALLPLNSDIKDPQRRPSIASVFALDTSGSMAACHCNPEGEGGRVVLGPRGDTGGVNKTDIARTAAARAIEVLTDQDEVGILAFSASSRFVVPLSQLPSEEVIRGGLASLQPRGPTRIPQAMQSAVEALKTSKASLKHIVLFTDGFTNQKELVPVARWIRRQGVTLSVLATGEGAGDELKQMAEAGGGRYYAGRNLHEIPELMMEEVMKAVRTYVNEGVFFPKITGSSPAADALSSTPALLGYIGTSPKSSASVPLSIGEYDDPLLATWRAGLGITTSWTSDAKPRWSKRWVDWKGFADFWSGVVRETLPEAPRPGFSTDAIATSAGLEIRVEAEEEIPEGTTATARVVGPEGETQRVELARSGLSSFSGTAGIGPAGVYLISVALRDGDELLYRETVGAVRSYSPEYQPGPADQTLLREVAAAGGGRYEIAPSNSFDPDLPTGHRTVEVVSWLVLLAALLLPVDVALRRVIITRDDIAAAKAWRPGWLRTARRRPAPGEAQETSHIGRLLNHKRRKQP
jgi:Mg-chelatase subunit ChlD